MGELNLDITEPIKQSACIFVDLFPGGAIYGITDLEKIVWAKSSQKLNIEAYEPGATLIVGSALHQSITTGRPASEVIPRNVYGVRLLVHAYPLVHETSVKGSIFVIIPKIHPVIAAISDFAPIVVKIFP